MGTEIEHKYLVAAERLPDLYEGVFMEQGYLSYDPCIRVRATYERAWVTFKGRGLLIRKEFEIRIPRRLGLWLLTKCEKTLTKIRYECEFAGYVWEVDQFFGPNDGKWLAEIEVPTAKSIFDLPPWVTDEVTHDPRYQNANIVRLGFP